MSNYPKTAPKPAKNALSDWLSWIEQLHPQEIELGLERVSTVGERLGLLHFQCPVVTVGGTNGKGSCVATMEAVLKEAGYRVGAYFSPHLQRYNERIRIAGDYVSNDALCEAFDAINQARGDISLTYFEWGTLAALWLFQKAKLDAVILEVGLGGRLDAVNIVDPTLSVITTVDLDHTEWLGSDRESIGKEKAGIFRAGKPAVCGDFNPPKTLQEIADVLKAPLYCQGVDFGYDSPLFAQGDLNAVEPDAYKWVFWCGQSRRIVLPPTQFLQQNVSTALMALILLTETLSISEEAICRGVSRAFLPGRFQKISEHPQVILDVAHNPQGCQQLSRQLKAKPFTGVTYAIVGMLQEKNHVESLKSLITTIDHWFVANLDTRRGCSACTLVETLKLLGAKHVSVFTSIPEAYQEALNIAQINDRIVVFGSFYAVEPVLRTLPSIGKN
jgi:dihydrofolate synthase/folylpolyglutamate synthase